MKPTAFPRFGLDLPHGCFLISHYFSKRTSQLNTAEDIVASLGDPVNAPLLSNPQRPLVFQICTKKMPHLACSANSNADDNKWIALMDQFNGAAQLVLQSPPLSGNLCLPARCPTTAAGTVDGSGGTGFAPKSGNLQCTIGWCVSNGEHEREYRRIDRLGRARLVQILRFQLQFCQDESELLNFYNGYLALNDMHHAGMLAAYDPDPANFTCIRRTAPHRTNGCRNWT